MSPLRFYTNHKLKQLVIIISAFFLMLFAPHALFAYQDSYRTKLRVGTEITEEFYLGLTFAVIAILLFLAAMILSRIDRATLYKHIVSIEKRMWFRGLIVGLTVVMFVLLAGGIGMKQSTSSLNFIIRLLPREMVLVVATLGAVCTRRPFWIALLLLNVFYWIMVGSKAALFLAAITAIFLHGLEGWKIRPSHILWGALLVVILPASFMIIAGLRLGISPLELLQVMIDVPETREVFFNRILTRVSWFDGMQLTPNHAFPLMHFSSYEFVSNAIARLFPGVGAPEEPFGQQIIYLFKATDLDEFSGAIGMPGVFKIMYYNHGILGIIPLMLMIFGFFFFIGRMTASTKPFVALVGFSVFIVGVSSMMISGNLDSALGKSIPILITGLVIAGITRLMFGARLSQRPAFQ